MRSNLGKWAWLGPAIVIVGAMLRSGSDDPVMVGVLLAMLLAYGARQLYVRRRTRKRRDRQTGAYGLWWGRVWRIYDGGLWQPRGWIGAAFGNKSVAVSLQATADGLAFIPSRLAQWCHLPPVELAWTEVAGAYLVGSGRVMPDGTFSLTKQARVCIEVVGDRLTDMFRPLTDDEAEQVSLSAEERRLVDQEALSFAREAFGPGYRFGARPLLFITDDPAGVVELIKGRARGRLATSEPGLVVNIDGTGDGGC